MKKIKCTVASLINKVMLGRILEKASKTTDLQLQPIYTPSASSFMQAARNSKSTSFIAGVLILIMMSVTFSSCFTSGYGCKGRSRSITRVN